MSETFMHNLATILRTSGMLLVALGASGVVLFGFTTDSISYAYRFVIVFIASIFITNMLSNVTVLCIKGS